MSNNTKDITIKYLKVLNLGSGDSDGKIMFRL